MSEIDLEMLRKPFPQEMIKKRKGNFGKMLDYVETHNVIERLNQGFKCQCMVGVL